METIYKVDRKNAAYCYPLLEPSDLEETFLRLAQQWRQETGMMSLVTKMVMHPAYQRIIGMGQPVVPLILRELEREPDHWFWALQSITGANPVEPEQRGPVNANGRSMDTMGQGAWLQMVGWKSTRKTN